MKNLFVLFLVAAAGTLHAAEPVHRYMVSTRGPVQQERLPFQIDSAREVDRLRHLDVMILDLTPAEAEALRRSPGVRWVEPDGKVSIAGTAPRPRLVNGAPPSNRSTDSSERAIQSARDLDAQTTPWGIAAVRAAEVWNHTRGAGIKVAVLDSGIDHTHPDLKGVYKGGYDFVNNDADPMDDNGHGTHVAGTIAAADDTFGVVGVAPEVELYGLKVLDKEGSGRHANIVRAIDWSIANGMHLMNLSLGGSDPSPTLEIALRRARDAGVLAIVASGNKHSEFPNQLAYPAAYSSVIAVGAYNEARRKASFSQRGTGLKLVAPGVSVLSTSIVGRNEIAAIQTSSRQIIGAPMENSPRRNFAGELVFAGLGRQGQFPAGTAGRVALIQRGEITFAEKSKNAKAAGAVGVIIYNHEQGDFLGTLGEEAFDFLPTIATSQELGLVLRQLETTHVNVRFMTDDFAVNQGTSMAAPHVAGVAALIWSLIPDATVDQIQTALTMSAGDLGDAGFDITYGFGEVDARAAAYYVAPELFPPTQRRRASRP
jgi:serine protease